MKTQFDIHKLIAKGKIESELELERAFIADRKLKQLSKDNPSLKALRKKLRNLIEDFENSNWAGKSKISDKKIRESEIAELIAEKERVFLQYRKKLIRNKLATLNINQQELGLILGHKSKSYMSELMNGISPFSLRDLVIINRLLKIDLIHLIPTILPQQDRKRIKSSVEKLDNPKLKLSQEDFEYV